MADIVTAKSVTWGQARQIQIAEGKVDQTIASLLREWAVAHPEELVAFDRHMKFQRRENGYRRAWGGERGKLAAGARIAEIPKSLWNFFRRRYRADFFDNQDLLEKFFQHFKVGMFRPNDRYTFNRTR